MAYNQDDPNAPLQWNYQGSPNWQQNIQTLQPGQQPQQTMPVPIPQQQYQSPWTGQQGGQNPFSSGMSPEAVRNAVTSYYGNRGVTPQGNSIDYWTNKYSEFGNNDPNYFYQRLQNADEFTGGPGAGGGGGVAGEWGNNANSLYNMLLGTANQSLQVNPNDPIIKNQADAYAAMNERAQRNYLGNLAEQAGPNANISAERRASAEKLGQANAAFEAQLMGQELAARRGETAQARSLLLQQLLNELGLSQQAYQFDQNQQMAYSPFGGGY